MSIELSADAAFELGLDATGRDGNPHFPYTRDNVVDALSWKRLHPRGIINRNVVQRYIGQFNQAVSEHDGEQAESIEKELYLKILRAVAEGRYESDGEREVCIRMALKLEDIDTSVGRAR
jgi:hypothetical protein